MDIRVEIENAKRAYDSTPRWRFFQRRDRLRYWQLCLGVLREFEQTRRQLQAERERGR